MTSGHCTEHLSEKAKFFWKNAGHTNHAVRNATLHKKPDKINEYKEDWAIYKLDNKIKLDKYPKVIASNNVNLADSDLISVGYPISNDEIHITNSCKYIGKGRYNKYSFVTNCYTEVGTSGGPIFYVGKSDELYFIGIRSGPQSGLFINSGTRETRSEVFLPHLKD